MIRTYSSDVDRIIREISREIETITDAIATGKPQSWEEYKRMVGRRSGLETALAIVRDPSREEDVRRVQDGVREEMVKQ